LPIETFNYLALLATLGKLGRTENEVAIHILVREVYVMHAQRCLRYLFWADYTINRILRNGCRLLFGTGRWLRPAELLDPARDHLLGLRGPAKFRGPRPDHLLGCLAVRLPSQGGGNTNTNRN
jgi:hypothetical protein